DRDVNRATVYEERAMGMVSNIRMPGNSTMDCNMRRTCNLGVRRTVAAAFRWRCIEIGCTAKHCGKGHRHDNQDEAFHVLFLRCETAFGEVCPAFGRDIIELAGSVLRRRGVEALRRNPEEFAKVGLAG